MTPEQRRVVHSSKSVEWQTPPEVFDPLREEFCFAIDVCAAPGMERCAKAIRPEHDGLSVDWACWGGVCWMNPPYGRGVIEKWVAKARLEADRGCLVVALLPARTDTKWWHEHVLGRKENEIRFVRGRIRFLLPDGTRADPAPFPSVIVVFHPRS